VGYAENEVFGLVTGAKTFAELLVVFLVDNLLLTRDRLRQLLQLLDVVLTCKESSVEWPHIAMDAHTGIKEMDLHPMFSKQQAHH